MPSLLPSPLNPPPKAVCLLSGGLDSITSMVIAQESGFQAFALSFSYGQRHSIELSRAKVLAIQHKASQHLILDCDLRKMGGSALTSDIPVPKNRPMSEMSQGIPTTYVPARNTVFLSLALAWAEVIGATDIFLGVNALDYSGYPDCRPEYIAAFETLANLATQAGVEGARKFKIHTPLILLSKAEIIQRGTALGIDYAQTISCYDPSESGTPCGLCDSCLLRAKGFAEAGLKDPVM